MNPLLRYGFEKLARERREAGIDGVSADRPLRRRSGGAGARVCARHGLDTVFLAAPTSSERRLQLVAEHSTGFVYLVSRTGVTGEQQSLSEAAAPLVGAYAAYNGTAAGRRFRDQHARAGGGSSANRGWCRGG